MGHTHTSHAVMQNAYNANFSSQQMFKRPATPAAYSGSSNQGLWMVLHKQEAPNSLTTLGFATDISANYIIGELSEQYQAIIDKLHSDKAEVFSIPNEKSVASSLTNPQIIIEKIKQKTQLSYDDISNILKCDRATINRWMKNPQQRIQKAKLKRLNTVNSALKSIEAIIDHPFGHLMYSTLIDAQSIFDLLCETKIDVNAIEDFASKLADSIQTETLTAKGAKSIQDAINNPKPPSEKALKALRRFKEKGLHLTDEDS